MSRLALKAKSILHAITKPFRKTAKKQPDNIVMVDEVAYPKTPPPRCVRRHAARRKATISSAAAKSMMLGKFRPMGIPYAAGPSNQRKERKKRRCAHAHGDRHAFTR